MKGLKKMIKFCSNKLLEENFEVICDEIDNRKGDIND